MKSPNFMFSLFCLVLAFVSLTSAVSESCALTSQTKSRSYTTLSIVDSGHTLNEISGLAASRQTYQGEEVWWFLNDGGDGKLVAMSKSKGRILTLNLKSHPLVRTSSIDWESLSLGPCVDWSGDCLFVGDVGDNAARTSKGVKGKSSRVIYKLPEPTLPVRKTKMDYARNGPLKRYIFTYPTGPSGRKTLDCESIFVDWTGDSKGGKKGDIYLLSKWQKDQRGWNRLYKLSIADQQRGRSSTQLTIVAGHQTNLVDDNFYVKNAWKGADMSNKGNLIVARDYDKVYLFPRRSDQTVADAFASRCNKIFQSTITRVQSQYETVTVSSDGKRLYEISERNAATSSMDLYYFDISGIRLPAGSSPSPVRPRPAPVRPRPAPVRPRPAPVRPRPAPVRPSRPRPSGPCGLSSSTRKFSYPCLDKCDGQNKCKVSGRSSRRLCGPCGTRKTSRATAAEEASESTGIQRTQQEQTQSRVIVVDESSSSSSSSSFAVAALALSSVVILLTLVLLIVIARRS